MGHAHTTTGRHGSRALGDRLRRVGGRRRRMGSQPIGVGGDRCDRRRVPIEDTWGAIGGLVDAGKVRWVGVSNFDRTLIERCGAIRHVDSLQQEFSLVRPEDRELIRWCGEAGIGVLSYSPLGAGLLTGAFDREDAQRIDDWRASDGLTSVGHLDLLFALVDGMRPVAERLGVSLPQLALAWNWQQPGVTSAIAGSRDAEHTRSNAAAGSLELDGGTLAELDALIDPAGTERS